MKKLILAISIAAISASQAVVVVADTGGFSRAVADSSNVAIPAGSGYIGVGYFGSIADGALSTTSAIDLAADFQQFGSSFQFGLSGFEGFYEGSVDGGRVGATSPFLGQNVYLVAGNGATLDTSTEAMIYKFGATFPNDEGSPAPADLGLSLDGTAANYLVGGPGSTVNIAGSDIPASNMQVLVPEPSIAILGALGFLGLARRRR